MCDLAPGLFQELVGSVFITYACVTYVGPLTPFVVENVKEIHQRGNYSRQVTTSVTHHHCFVDGACRPTRWGVVCRYY